MELTEELKEKFAEIVLSHNGISNGNPDIIEAMFEAYLIDREWISVEDQSPISGETIEVCEFDVPNKVFNFKYNNEFKNWCFTHWRYANPFPKKPNQ